MVKKIYCDVYTEYYLNQAGSGFSNVYAGPVYQKGYGIGSFLGGLFRSVYPILKRGASAVGTELFKSGKNIISDIVNSQDPQQVIKKRGKETLSNLSKIVGDKMFGEGYKPRLLNKRAHSPSKNRAVKKQKKKDTKVKSKPDSKKKVVKKKKKNTQRHKSDIFDIFV